MAKTPPNVTPIIDWLLEEGRFLPELDELVGQLGDRLLSACVPLWRVRFSGRTLHPLVAGVTSVWERDRGSAEGAVAAHGLETRSGYAGSPLQIIVSSGAEFRKRLDGGLTAEDHSVLHELKARGATDYFGLPLRAAAIAPAVLVFVSDAEEGFSADTVKALRRIAAVVAPITEVYRSHWIAEAVAEAYLGARTGRRVLAGQITRGDIETITAAIFMSDIRGWTALNMRGAPEAALALANRYFEVVAQAVEANGGEILKLIGDGILAIFPADEADSDGRVACAQAMAAARAALTLAEAAEPPLEARFGIGMHFGQVLYGNVGSETRLDFTVLGRAVNLAARIEALCDRLGQQVLFSEAFAERLTERTTVVARETLKGYDTPADILTAPVDAR